jgi:zinc protease
MRPASVPVLTAVLATALLVSGCAFQRGGPATTRAAAPIPDRPEQLVFPPLEFHPPSAAPFRVPLAAGPVVYIAEDRELPLVNLHILVRTGHWVEPEGKEGLTDLGGSLLVRGGTEARTAEELEERLAFLAANCSSWIEGPVGNVSLNLLSKDLDEGLAILREVLTQPRFQQDRFDLQKQQMLQAMKQRNDHSASIESIEQSILAYGAHFWDNRYQTADSVNGITREDLLEFHRRWYFPSNFILAVSGDFDRADMIQKLEKLFTNWPWQGSPPPPIPRDIEMAPPGVYLVNKEVNQGRVSLLLPGIMRGSSDGAAVTMMNDILGGSGFASRLVNRIRSDEGLAYSVGSSFRAGIYFPYAFVASLQTKSATVPYAAAIVIEEIKRIAAEPVRPEELKNAQRGLIDRLPRSFASKAQIVGLFANEEYTGRYATDPDYWQTVVPRVSAVTVEDVQRVAQKYLTPERLVILVVGHKEEILKGHPDQAVKLPDLGGGQFIELPLRDPFSLKPMAPEAKPDPEPDTP